MAVVIWAKRLRQEEGATQPATDTLTEFPLFTQPPPELQILVWKHAIPSVEVYKFGFDTSLQTNEFCQPGSDQYFICQYGIFLEILRGVDFVDLVRKVALVMEWPFLNKMGHCPDFELKLARDDFSIYGLCTLWNFEPLHKVYLLQQVDGNQSTSAFRDLLKPLEIADICGCEDKQHFHETNVYETLDRIGEMRCLSVIEELARCLDSESRLNLCAGDLRDEHGRLRSVAEMMQMDAVDDEVDDEVNDEVT